MKNILVIDGNSIINRAFYGVRPLTTKTGKNTNAIFGMVNILSRQMEKIKPTYAAVAFDVHAPTFRHLMYDEYKAGRHPTPPELLEQFDDAKAILSMMGLHVLELPGYEADDIQGTVASMAHGKEDVKAFILTGDRDLLQLIDDDIHVLLATNTDTIDMDTAAFEEKYGVAPSRFIYMKALMGDSSDHIPGVGGIGEKTAASLITNFGTLDGVYENINDARISKGVREKLLRDKEQAYLSLKLVTICTEVPMKKDLEDLRLKEMDKAGLYRKFNELELRSFLTRFSLTPPTEAPAAGPTESAPLPTADVRPLTMEDVVHLSSCARLGVWENDGKYQLSDGKDSFSFDSLTEISVLIPGKDILCFDGKKLCKALHALGITTDTTRFSDLLLYGYLLNPGNGTPEPSMLASAFLGTETVNALLLFRLEEELAKKLRENGEEKVLTELELPLIPVLASMEEVGLQIDMDGMRDFSEALGALADDLANRIYMQAGEIFNINSPKQLGEVLFIKLGLGQTKKKTKSGYSTNAETLEELRGTSPIIEDVLEYRQVTKLRSTYAAALPEAADEKHRVHTDFKQALTATGRLSSAEPNLQNIPIRTKMGREMRRFFVAKEGCTLIDADYSQIELRLLAHIAADDAMCRAFLDGEDIHRKTAAAVFGLPEEAVSEELRKRAKAVNFGIVYGISGFSLAKDIGTSVAEANRYIKNYLYSYPSIDTYLTSVVEEAEKNGYTATPMGRRRYIPELKAQNAMVRAFGKRVAMNAPIQGAAADIVKLAMIRVYHRLKEEVPDAKLVMQVHDELLVETPVQDANKVKAILKEEMENVVSLRVPLTVDVTEGKNWLEQM